MVKRLICGCIAFRDGDGDEKVQRIVEDGMGRTLGSGLGTRDNGDGRRDGGGQGMFVCSEANAINITFPYCKARSYQPLAVSHNIAFCIPFLELSKYLQMVLDSSSWNPKLL